MQQRSTEWFTMRKQYIGASDASSVLGVSPWKTSYQLWIEKTSKDPNESIPNPRMQRGLDLEPKALSLFEQETGYLMSPKVLISPSHQFMMASLDGLCIDDKIAVEIKCPGFKDHEIALEGKVPDKYIPQLQHQLCVLNAEKMYYESYNPDHEKTLVIFEVYRDQTYIDNLIQKESEFYYKHMLTGIPPENEKIPPKIIESEKWVTLTNEYRRLENESKQHEKRKDEIKDLLIQIAENETASGNGISLQKIARKGNINYNSIPMLRNVNLEEFRKPTSNFWMIKEINNGMD
jgi:putative phage-type endonuclease